MTALDGALALWFVLTLAAALFVIYDLATGWASKFCEIGEGKEGGVE